MFAMQREKHCVNRDTSKVKRDTEERETVLVQGSVRDGSLEELTLETSVEVKWV